MSYPFPPDIADLVQQQIAAGYFDNEDDVLRFALGNLSGDEENDAHVRTIQDAIDLLQSGEEGRPLDEVAAEMRTKYGIPADA